MFQVSRRVKFAMVAATITLPLLGGCQKGKQHKEWVDQANNRWLDMRSAMMIEMAQQQFDTGDLDLADKTVREAMMIDSKSARLHVLAGRIRLERGQLERSYHLFTAAVELNEKLADAHYYQGVVLQRWKQFEAAYARYGRAFELESDNASYLLAMSEMLVQMDRMAEASALLEEKLTYFDQNSAIRAALGHIYMMDKRPDLAAKYFHQASLLSPDNLKIQEELALSQVAAGQNEAAIQTFTSLLANKEMNDRRDLHRAMAQAYVELGRRTEARQTYLGLARREPSDAGDWLRLGELAWQDEDLGGTLQAANRAIALAPQRHEGYLLAGMVWRKRDNLDNALSMFDRAAELAPDSAVPLILRGMSLQKAGRPVAAAQAYEEALKRDPSDHRAKKLLDSVAGVTQ